MPNQLSGDDAKTVWQTQPTAISAMTLKLIQSKARELQSKTRRKLIGLVVGPLAAAFLYAFAIREFSSVTEVLHSLFVSALVWSLAGLYFLSRGMPSTAFPPDAGLSTGLEFCREEINRRRNLLRRVLLWSLGPIVLALVAFTLGLVTTGAKGRGLFPNGLPFMALVVAWIFGYFVMREREFRELKHEIDELNDLERDNRQ